MNFIQEVLSLLERKQNKKTLDLKRDWFEFGRTKPSSVGNPLYSPKMTPHAIRFDDLKCEIITGLVQGTGTRYTLPMWDETDPTNCNVQTMVDSIFSQDAGATEGLVSGDFRVSGNTVLEGDLLVLGTQTIVESTVVQVADNIFRINSTGAPLDSGIEVVVPAGIKTWAWNDARGLWSTFGEDMATRDANISGALRMDGENLVNVVNEAEGLLSQDNDESLATVAAIIDYVNNSTGGGSGTGVNGVDKAEYEVIYTTDPGLTQAGAGQLIFNQATDEIYMSWLDLNNNNRRYALETILYSPGKKPFGLFTADKADPWINYNAQYFNPCNIEFLGVNCLPWDGTTPNLNPTQGSTGDDGGPGVPIQIVWSSSSDAIKQGGQGAVYATVYVHPDVVGQTIQTPVMSGSGLSFANEPIDDPKALATAFSNPGYVTFNPPLADPFTIYLNSSMTTIAGGGYYMERTEFDNLPSGSFGYISNWDDASQSWNKDIVSFTNPAAAPATGDPDLICTIDSRSLEVRMQGADQFVIPWIEGQQKGTGWAPQSAQAIVTLDMAGKEECLVDASGNSIGFDETITDVAYNPDQNILGHVDEEGIISIMPLAGADGYISQVALNGTDLEFTGTVDAFTGTIDLSSLLDDTNLARIISGALSGTELILTRDDASTISIDLSSLADTDTNDIDYVSDVQLSGTDLQFTGVGNGFSGTVDLSALGGSGGMALSDIVAGDKMLVSVNGVAGTVTISHQTTTTTPATSSTILSHSGTFDAIVDITHDAYGHITGYDTKTFTMPASGSAVYTAGDGLDLNTNEFSLTDVTRTNSSSTATPSHTDSFTVIDDITTNSKGQVTNVNVKTVTLPASGTGADGVITNVTFDSNTSVLDFTGSNGGFNGSINLAALADTETVTSLSRSGDLLLYSDENGSVTNVDLSDYDNPDQNLWANIAVAGQQTITANTTTDTLEFVAGAGIQLQTNTLQKKVFITNTVTDTNDIDYISNVVLNANSLDFTGIGNAFTGSIDLSTYANVPETVTSLSINANVLTYTDENGADTDIDLSLYLDDTNLARLVSGTLNGSTGIATFTRDDATTFDLDLSDLLDTDTTYVAGSAQNGNDVDITLDGSDGTATGFTLVAGTNITLSDNGSNQVTIDATGGIDTNTTYDLGAAELPGTGNIAIALGGSDSTNDVVTVQAGTNITLTDNGSNVFTIDAAGGGSSYTFGTYLTEAGGTVNHDSTTRSDSTSSAAPAHAGTFTAVDSVTTNATGHVTGVNVKTVTLPDSGEACMFGVNFQPNGAQTLQSGFFVIGQGTPNFPLGFRNNSNEDRRYVLTWTVQLSDNGTNGTGVKGFDYRVVQNSQSAPAGLIEWNDSQYSVSELDFSRTYTYTTGPIPHGNTLEIQVSGNSALEIVKAHLSVVDVTCDSLDADDVRLLDPRN